MRPVLLITGKDLRQRVRDRSALLVVLVIPFVLASILGLTLGNAGAGKVTFHFASARGDRGATADAFASLLAQLQQRRLVALRDAGSLAEARQLADTRKVAAAFVLPAGFSRRVSSGRPAALTVVGDPGEPIGTLVASSIAQGFVSRLNAINAAVATAIAAGPAGRREPTATLAAAAAAMPPPIIVDDVSAERKNLDPKTYYAAGMAVFFLFFTVQFGISTLLDERRDGTLARLAVAPMHRRAIIAGKALTSIVLGVVAVAALALSSSLLLGARWGNPLGVALLIGAGVIAATAVMALVVTLARTPEQAGYWQAIVALVLGMLGGAFFPVAQAGGAVQSLSLVTPHAWFLRGLRDLAGGAPASAALAPAGVILLIAAVCGTLALLRADRLLEL
jgi:ABC-2 type transport system permease protein